MPNRRKTNQQHIQDGTHRPGRHGDPDDNPKTDGLKAIPKPPPHLNKWAKLEWNRLLSGMIEMEMVETIDLGLIEQACTFYGVYRSVAINLPKEKDLFEFFDTRTAQNNNVMTTLEKCYKNYSDIAYKLGCSPVERSRIQIKKKPDTAANPFSASINKGA